MSRLPGKGLKDCQKELFWLLRSSGMPMTAIASALGLGHNTPANWVRERGGINPGKATPRRAGALTLDDRFTLAVGRAAGLTNVAIAERIGCHPSTVGRELRRNSELKSPTHKTPSYHPGRADTRATVRARRPKPSKLCRAMNPELHDHVQAELKQDWSPEQISKRLVLAFPDRPEMRVSPETIYQSLYVESRGALKRELTKHLRTGRSVRKPQKRSNARRPRVPDALGIANRPAEVTERAVPGHWEGDLITGALNKSAIGTLVERVTGFVTLLHLPDEHGAEQVRDAIIPAILGLPEALQLSVTWDQGVELAKHAEIMIATDIDIWFCDPHSPWQRGSNENTNGLLRQYFPKSTDLSIHSAARLAEVADLLNNRPRKRLGWLTPREALNNLLVASTA
jgi:IS30 family transposase